MRPTVELHNAYFFACEICGRDSFVRAVTITRAMAEAQVCDEDREAFDATEGDWFAMPEAVACTHCGAEFGVEDA